MELTEEEIDVLDKISEKGITVIINAFLPKSKDLHLIPDIYLRNTIYDQKLNVSKTISKKINN